VRYAPTTNQNVVTYTSVVEVNNDDLKLRPGMTANASIITAQRRDTLKIPNSALRFRPPDNAILKPPTNASAVSRSATNRATNVMASGTSPAELPTPPWVAEGRQPSGFEEIRKWRESLTPEQLELARLQFPGRGGRGQGGDGGGGRGGGGRGFGGGGGGRGLGGGGGGRGFGDPDVRQDGPVTRTIYVLARTKSPSGKEIEMAKPVTVRIGITDGSYSEVIEGLKEGDEVIAGVNTPTTATASVQVPQGSSPFGRGGGGFRGR
jgi:HlyD family secretion protein